MGREADNRVSKHCQGPAVCLQRLGKARRPQRALALFMTAFRGMRVAEVRDGVLYSTRFTGLCYSHGRENSTYGGSCLGSVWASNRLPLVTTSVGCSDGWKRVRLYAF